MIDLHCHLLPCIDDGPSSMEEAITLCRFMVANGIEQAVATPHIHLGRWDNDSEGIRAAYKLLLLELMQQEIPLQLAMAAEVRIDADILPLLALDKIPMLGHWSIANKSYNVLLLELPHNHVPAGTEKLIRWLKGRNIIAMIAHPERNKELQRNPQKLELLMQEGCLLQLTAASVAGEFGVAAEEFALKLLDRRAVTVIATDAHNIAGRRPLLAEARDVVTARCGANYAKELTVTNPERVAALLFSENDSGDKS